MGYGFTRQPGLVTGEWCTATIERHPPGVDYVGPDLPDELFGRAISARLLSVGEKNDDRFPARVRLEDPWLERHERQDLRRLYGSEPPPFPYVVRPDAYLLGTMDAGRFHTGDFCWIRICSISSPLSGTWMGRVTVIRAHAVEGDPPDSRRARAILDDTNIVLHALAEVRALLGHEPPCAYEIWSKPIEAENNLDRALWRAQRMAKETLTNAKSLLGRIKDAVLDDPSR